MSSWKSHSVWASRCSDGPRGVAVLPRLFFRTARSRKTFSSVWLRSQAWSVFQAFLKLHELFFFMLDEKGDPDRFFISSPNSVQTISCWIGNMVLSTFSDIKLPIGSCCAIKPGPSLVQWYAFRCVFEVMKTPAVRIPCKKPTWTKVKNLVGY